VVLGFTKCFAQPTEDVFHVASTGCLDRRTHGVVQMSAILPAEDETLAMLEDPVGDRFNRVPLAGVPEATTTVDEHLCSGFRHARYDVAHSAHVAVEREPRTSEPMATIEPSSRRRSRGEAKVSREAKGSPRTSCVKLPSKRVLRSTEDAQSEKHRRYG